VDAGGLVKVAAYVKEAIAYLGERAEPLTATIAAVAAPTSPAGGPSGGARSRGSFGTMPHFAHPGPGVKVAGVPPGSPAERAGIREGDVILQVDGREVANLAVFSAILKDLAPGQTVKAVVQRGGERLTLDVTVVAR
jgi:aminopeptidase N